LVNVSGYSKEELIGRVVFEMFCSESAEYAKTKAFPDFLKTGTIDELELQVCRKDGTIFDIAINASAIRNSEGEIIYTRSIWRNITERMKIQTRINASLKEKETLLHEIHHRVKNNMQVISSLLNLQANNIEDSRAKDVLKESQGRVFAMSAVHETLHGSENLSEIDLKSYLSKITTFIFQSYSVNHENVKLNSSVGEMPISIDHAYPLGLIINELISNSLKYAFPDERKGTINISMKKAGKKLELIVMDDGVGMSDRLDWINASTLGIQLVRALVENQLDGSIDMESNNGTKFTIKLNIET
jgi:PAS domain S-box-containing protein